MTSRAARTIAVLVGTDCHPFQRIIDWADKWAEANPADRVIVQYGHSAPPRTASGRAFISPTELATLLETSDVVIIHGGPATLSEARKASHLPLVFPRDPRHGEHVDDHQQRFSRWADGRDLAICVESAQELDARVAAAAGDKAGTRRLMEAETFGADEAARKLAALLHKRRTSANSASAGAPVVLYVAAPSGSVDTLLETAGGLASVAFLGDTRRLWQRGIIDNEDCSCGLPFHECTFWRAVGKTAFGGWDEVDVAGLSRLAGAATPARYLGPAVLAGRLQGRQQLARYSGYYQAVYAAARDVSGADVLVDSAEDPMLAYALSHNREIDLRFLELSLAATSWTSARTAAGQDKPSRLAALRAARALSRHSIPRASLSPTAVRDRHAVSACWARLGLPGSGDGAAGTVGRAPQPVHAVACHALADPRSGVGPGGAAAPGRGAGAGAGAATAGTGW
ncbi:hypothetical protein ACTWLI_13970 [Arthrobacter sp. Hor0625]|uniref:hypothetical protein n=1 Tax=Arthrobacter sp. Hor0625 TaxID=3457358 RepID=UPI00403EBB28